jgi:hypothetical protein
VAKSGKQLSKSLRQRGVRKKFADQIARAVSGAAKPKTARKAVSELTSVVAEIDDRLRGGPEKRSASARKAARTRKLKAQRRSQAAKRGARKRAHA